jgi:membrane dipeptidase
VLGLMALPFVVDLEDPSIERLVDHVDHAVAVMGIEHVVLGADFFAQIARAQAARAPAGGEEFIPISGLAGPEDYPALVEVLGRRGYEGARLEAILGSNLVRFLQRSLPA